MDNIQQDVCDTNLELRLGYSPVTWPQSDHHRRRKYLHKKPQPSIANPNSLEPSLSIGPPGSNYGLPQLKLATQRSSSLTTISSSLSKPTSDEEEEEDGRAQKKLRLTKEQSALMEGRFKEHSTLNPQQKQALAKTLNLSPRQVEVWFQNRRARNKMKQTEVSREFLRKWCETLAHENRRLEEEVRQLKTTKRSVCPTCNRVVGAANNGLESESFAPFNPFPHSAHC